jgi:hypothetical protein
MHRFAGEIFGAKATWDSLLDLDTWNSRWSVGNWRQRQYLADGEAGAEIATIRLCTHTGRPLGTPEYTACPERKRGERAPRRSDRSELRRDALGDGNFRIAATG